jgi:hypothetical protein
MKNHKKRKASSCFAYQQLEALIFYFGLAITTKKMGRIEIQPL